MTVILGCTCTPYPYGDGPEEDCRVHGRTPDLDDRSAATEQEFRDRIAAFESAPTPPEVREAAVVEEVARAMAEAQGVGRTATPLTRRLAAAAVAAYRAQDGGAEEAVRRVELERHRRGDGPSAHLCTYCVKTWPCTAVKTATYGAAS